MENKNELVAKVNDLFITIRYKYIMQLNGAGYKTFNSSKNENHCSLFDPLIENHLNHNTTYGVFCYNKSKFITFDVDYEDIGQAKTIVHLLYKVLESFNVPVNRIYTSTSGNKGYHVDLYFKEDILVRKLKTFFEIVVNKVNEFTETGQFDGKIELRPTPTQAVKLPLGINLKNPNKETRICWYIDVHNKFLPIKNYDYFLSIEKLDSNIILNIIKHNKQNLVNKMGKRRQTLPVKNEQHFESTPLTWGEVEDLFENGMTMPNTRKNCLIMLARYFFTLNCDRAECKEKLSDWMSRQNPHLYKTPYNECLKDIDSIIDWVFRNNARLTEEKAEVTLSKEEFQQIYKIKKKLRLVFFSLLLHSKRHGDRNQSFFMTFEMLGTASNLSSKTVLDHVNQLEQLGHIKILKRNQIYFDGNGYHSTPNVYSVLLDKTENETHVVKIVFPQDGKLNYHVLYFKYFVHFLRADLIST